MTRQRQALAAVTSAVIALALGLGGGPAATAAPGGDSASVTNDVRDTGPDIDKGKKIELEQSNQSSRRKAPGGGGTSSGQIGTQRTWLGLNDYAGRYYLKDYTLKGEGTNIEVWVANELAFPTIGTSTDCRNDLGLTTVTDAQVNGFIREFDRNIYPTESRAFSTPTPRDGTKATLPDAIGLPADTYKGNGAKIVVLVDNVRDANYYYFDPSKPDAKVNGQTYIAGFFSSQLNQYFDRNVMTIDAFDWLHRTGKTPPDNSADAAYQACATALGRAGLGTARPQMYEGTFAHEYQHLLESYADPDEVNWINEGLSDYAQTLVGYVDTRIAPDQPKADGHLSCFMGYQPQSYGGPENSLTLWGDQGPPEILCDYGAAYSMIQYLVSRFGPKVATFLHKDPANGLASLDNYLKSRRERTTARQVLRDWAAMIAVDQAMDKAREHSERYTADSLSSKINWDNPQAYSTPGAPPNGSDYVRLRGADGTYLSARNLKSLTFTGSKTLEPTPLEWTVSATPPDTIGPDDDCSVTPAAGTGAPALYSGCGDMLDRAAAAQVTVPATGATLTFDTLYDIEEGWDFGFVQVSADGGATWKTVQTAAMTSAHDPGALAGIVANLPGFTGASDGWVSQSADLSAYAGKTVLLAFRYMTDPASAESGFWVRNVKVGGTAVATDSLGGWKSASQWRPTPVQGFSVQLVSYNSTARRGEVEVTKLTFGGFSASLSGWRLREAVAEGADVVAVIVMQDDDSESQTAQARYVLTANGVTQPGG